MEYRIYFKLAGNITNFDEANKYLSEEDMIKYAGKLNNYLESIVFSLLDKHLGTVLIKAKRKLSTREMIITENYVVGQLVDGIGEGFLGQDFCAFGDVSIGNITKISQV